MDYTFVEGAVDAILPEFERSNTFAFDLETTGLQPSDSRILLMQIGFPTKQFVVSTFKSQVDKLLPYLRSPKWLKLIHNAKFEQKFMQHYHDTHIRNVFDTMLAEQVIASEKRPRSLADVVLKYTGITLDKSSQTSFTRMKPMEMFTDEQLEYAARDVEILFPVYEAQKAKLLEDGQYTVAETEFALAGVVAAMEIEGVPINAQQWRAHISDVIIEKQESEQKMYSIVYDDNNIRSEQIGMFERQPGLNLKSPDQMLKVLRDLGLDIPDTNERTLSVIDHPAAQQLVHHREIVKKIDSYGENFLNHIHPFTGRIHPDFQQIGTETGRFSCREPNVQNIPEDFRAFVGGAKDYKLVGADYAQIELRIIAEISQDPGLIRAFNTGDDPHKSTAAIMFNIPLENVSKEQRYIAKTINFGLAYGMQGPKLRDMLNKGKPDNEKLPINKVYALVDQYRRTYKKVTDWFEQAGADAYRKGYSMTLTGRKRYFNRPTTQNSDEMQKQVAAIKRAGGNAPIQGTSADITKMAMVDLYFDLHQYGYKAELINAVHDEIIVLAHKSHADAVKEIVRTSMERSAQEVLKKVPVTVETYISDYWQK
jgi:DNA polymerase-1